MRDRLHWWFCAACYGLYLHLPWWVSKRATFMLPHVGMYAYNDDFDDFRRTLAWNRAGRPDEGEFALYTTEAIDIALSALSQHQEKE